MPLTQDQAGRKHGWRSGLERGVGAVLSDHYPGEWGYESGRIHFVQPAKDRFWTPDFFLDNGIIIETKGRWTRADRMKVKMVVEQFPRLSELGILRIVFSNARSRISKRSSTTYAAYAERIGLLWGHKQIPKAWLEEEYCPERAAAIEEIVEVL